MILRLININILYEFSKEFIIYTIYLNTIFKYSRLLGMRGYQ